MREKKNQYALMDDPVMDEPADTHIRGTIPRAGGKVEFWMSIPRPKGVSIDEWEEIQQAKWDRIWGKKRVG